MSLLPPHKKKEKEGQMRTTKGEGFKWKPWILFKKQSNVNCLLLKKEEAMASVRGRATEKTHETDLWS